MQIGILGAGMVGRAMAIDLAKTYNGTSFDISGHSLQLLSQKNNSIKTIKADLTDYDNYNTLLAGFDFIISAVPGFIGYKTLEAVINAKKMLWTFHFFLKMRWSLMIWPDKIMSQLLWIVVLRRA